MNKYYILLFFYIIVYQLNAQDAPFLPSIKWYTIQEAEKLCKENPRPVFIDFYTDWCGWCKKMDMSTYLDNQVISYLNSYYYPVKLDAETLDTIVYKDSTYINKNLGKQSTHDLAIKLLNRQLSYPSVLFMDKSFNPITLVPGYRTAMELLPILIFINEDIYKSWTSYPDFEKYFQKTYPPNNQTGYNITKSVVNWLSLQEAFEKTKKEPRKILLDFYLPWKVGCTMMMTTTYNQPDIGKYINEKYYPVRINALTRDTLVFGDKYINANPDPSYHQLPVAMLQGKMDFPAIIWLDEELKMVNKMQMYLTPENIEPILTYFAENAYKSANWETYMKSFKPTLIKEIKIDSVIIK